MQNDAWAEKVCEIECENEDGCDEEEEKKKLSLQELRVKVLGDKVLKNYRTYDRYLLRFLHFNNFEVDPAFKQMQDYVELLLKHPDWYPIEFSQTTKELLKRKAKAFLPHKDKLGRRIFVAQLGKIDFSKTSPTEEAKLDELWYEMIMDDPETQAKGVAIVLDMKNISMGMIQWMVPHNMKISTRKTELYPCKEIIIHIVNTSMMTNVIQKVAWRFVSEEMKKTIHFHYDNWLSLHDHIDPGVLPQEYGGTGPEIDFEELTQAFLKHEDEIVAKISHKLFDEDP